MSGLRVRTRIRHRLAPINAVTCTTQPTINYMPAFTLSTGMPTIRTYLQLTVRDAFEGVTSPALGWIGLTSHSSLAMANGEICMLAHQAFSLPCRCKSWW